MAMYVDTHNHFHKYVEDFDDALEDITNEGILVGAVSCNIPEYERTLEIAGLSDLILPAFGVHPAVASEHMSKLESIGAIAEKALMLGEIGLDHLYEEDASKYPLQVDLLETFLEAAQKHDTIMTLHVAGAESEVLSILDNYSVSRVIFHDYYGPLELANKIIDRGFFYSFDRSYRDEYKSEIPGWEERRKISAIVPDDLMLVETDGPNRPPSRMPSVSLREVIENLAVLRSTTPEEVSDRARSNFLRLLRGDSRLSKFRRTLGGQ